MIRADILGYNYRGKHDYTVCIKNYTIVIYTENATP